LNYEALHHPLNPQNTPKNTPFYEGLNPTGGDFIPFGPGYCTVIARLLLGFDTIDARGKGGFKGELGPP
jgi:hypothetical protein